MADSMPSELDQLRWENARLIGLLEADGIAWRSGAPAPTKPEPVTEAAPAKSPSSTQEKVTLFLNLFRGRDHLYALRRPAPISSGQASTKSLRWPAATFSTGICCLSPRRAQQAIRCQAHAHVPGQVVSY